MCATLLRVVLGGGDYGFGFSGLDDSRDEALAQFRGDLFHVRAAGEVDDFVGVAAEVVEMALDVMIAPGLGGV